MKPARATSETPMAFSQKWSFTASTPTTGFRCISNALSLKEFKKLCHHLSFTCDVHQGRNCSCGKQQHGRWHGAQRGESSAVDTSPLTRSVEFLISSAYAAYLQSSGTGLPLSWIDYKGTAKPLFPIGLVNCYGVVGWIRMYSSDRQEVLGYMRIRPCFVLWFILESLWCWCGNRFQNWLIYELFFTVG